MTPRKHEKRKERSAPLREPVTLAASAPSEQAKRRRYATLFGVGMILTATLIIYGQTIRVPTIDYEDTFYLIRSAYVHVSPSFGKLGAVWSEPYFANFHPVTTTTWLVDRSLADKSKPFDSTPFRVSQLLYAVVAGCLVMAIYRRLGIPAYLASLGALLYAVHPIHTEVVAWLSARKDLISLIFILACVLAWLWARGAVTTNEWRMRYAIAVVLGLLSVLSKPVAVILPPLFVAYEFCSGAHGNVLRENWTETMYDLLVRRTLILSVIFAVVGIGSTEIFRPLLARDPAHGGWLVWVLVTATLLMMLVAPGPDEITSFRTGTAVGVRVIGVPFAVLSAIFGAGAAWTFWAQQQVGAIKGGFGFLRTLNLTCEAMLAYAVKAVFPFGMSPSYTWSEYPNISLKGALGALLVCAMLFAALNLAGSPRPNRRLIAFGLFWHLIALLPVANLVPTSTKMADRYLFVPTVGSILVLVGLVAPWFENSREKRLAAFAVLLLAALGYTAWSYQRTEVWCGKTMRWNGAPQPDLSLWTSAVEVNPDDMFARTNLGLSYLRLTPPETGRALEHLTRALQLGEQSQARITGDKHLVLSPVYETLADAYLTDASQLSAGAIGSENWNKKEAAYENAVKFFRLATQTPSGFASDDARVFSRLAESDEGRAQIDAQKLGQAPPENREALIRGRDELWRESDASIQRAREILRNGNVSATDANYRTVILDWGNTVFGREVGASDDEKARYYEEALRRYQQAAELLPNDPRPILYQGLCYERLTAIAKSTEERQREFALGEQVLRRTLAISSDTPDYNPGLAYKELAVLYSHVNDYRSALDSLKQARDVNTDPAEEATLAQDIRSVEEFLAGQQKGK